MLDSSDTDRMLGGNGWCSGFNKENGKACNCREFQPFLNRPTHCEECQHGKSLHDKRCHTHLPVDRTARAIFKKMTQTDNNNSMLVSADSPSTQATRTEARKEAASGLKGLKGKVYMTSHRGNAVDTNCDFRESVSLKILKEVSDLIKLAVSVFGQLVLMYVFQ